MSLGKASPPKTAIELGKKSWQSWSFAMSKAFAAPLTFTSYASFGYFSPREDKMAARCSM